MPLELRKKICVQFLQSQSEIGLPILQIHNNFAPIFYACYTVEFKGVRFEVKKPNRLWSTLQARELNKWVTSTGSDSTLVVLVPRHHNVTFHAPALSPGVLHQPVVLSLVCSITNS